MAVSYRAPSCNKGGYRNLSAQEFQLPVTVHGLEQVGQEAIPAERVVGVDIFVEVVVVFIVYVEARIFHKGRCPEEYEIRHISGCQVGYVALVLAVVIVGDLVLIAVQAGRTKHARLNADAGDLDNTAAILRRFLRLRRRGLAAGGEYKAKNKRGTDNLFYNHHPEHGIRQLYPICIISPTKVSARKCTFRRKRMRITVASGGEKRYNAYLAEIRS